MNPLRAALADYLSVRRAMGYTLTRTGGLLAQFVAYLEVQPTPSPPPLPAHIRSPPKPPSARIG